MSEENSPDMNEALEIVAKKYSGYVYDLFLEVHYLRYIVSKVVESSPDLKKIITDETFKEARDFGLQQMIAYMQKKND